VREIVVPAQGFEHAAIPTCAAARRVTGVLLPGGERLQVKALRETGASGPPQPRFYP